MLTGVLGSDDATLVGGAANFAGKDAATGKTVTLTGVSLGGTQAGDYILSDPTPTTTASITPLTINGSIATASRVYDGSNHATITSRTLAGVIGADQVTLTGGTATFDTKDVGQQQDRDRYRPDPRRRQAGDYLLANPSETAVANITRLGGQRGGDHFRQDLRRHEPRHDHRRNAGWRARRRRCDLTVGGAA